MKTVIKAISAFLPEHRVSNENLVSSGRVPYDAAAILQKTGVANRPTAGVEQSTSDLAVAAGEKLFSSGVAERRTVDWVIACTQTPDYMVPATACLLQHRLGLSSDVACWDLGLSCSGFVYGLVIADSLIRAGTARRVLLINADVYTKFLHPNDPTTVTLFGDGATACWLVGEERDDGGLVAHKLGTDGRGFDRFIRRRGGSRSPALLSPADPGDSADFITMDGPAIFRFVEKAVPENVANLLGGQRLSIEDVDLFVFHQGSRYMLETLRRRISIPRERMPIELEDTGNLVSASIPMTLARLAARSPDLLKGALAVLCGFGAGLSYGSVLYRFPAEGILAVS